jgi:diguanylate cyclase (GGDEF)-like protein/putative nucleotidyltransferase with HDIG domain
LSNPPQDTDNPSVVTKPSHSMPGQEIDALRRHICQILGFDIALIDIIRGNSIDNLFTFYAEDPGDDFNIEQLRDADGNTLDLSDNALSQKVRSTYAPYVGKAVPLDYAGDEEEEPTYPYIIVPISDGQGEASKMVKGLIRVVSFDTTKTIENTDVSNVRMIGQHLATLIPYLASAIESPVEKPAADTAETIEPIVVAHNNRAVRRRLSRSLGGEFTIVEADDAGKVLQNLENQAISMMVLDSALVDGSGESLVRVLKAPSSRWKNIPIILVTPEADPNSKVEGLNAGADDCVTDTCLDAELLARVRAGLRFRKTERELASQLHLLEDYAARLEYAKEVERLAASKISTEKTAIDAKNQQIAMSLREIQMLRDQDLRLRRISDCIRRSFAIEENIGEVLESLAGWLDLDCCFVTLTEECDEPDIIRREYAQHEGYRVVEHDYDLAILDKFKNFTRQELLWVNDVKRDKRVEPFREILSNYHMYSVFYAPITYQEKLLGILGGHKCETQAQWSQHYETFFGQIADQLAIGVTNARLYKRVERQATTDGLTNLFNHRTGQEKLAEQMRLAERYQRNLAVVMMDIDHFKSINDTYGHPVGDTVLKSVARIIRRDCRDVDIPVRYGGEEFLLVLPEVNQEGAVVVAERLRKTLQREVIIHDEVQLSVTASIGVAAYPEDGEGQHHLLELADKALYMSKRMGRNQVHTAADLMFQELEKKEQQPVVSAAPTAAAAESANNAQAAAEGENREGLVPEVVEMVKAMAGALYAKSEYNKVHHLETARFSEMVGKVLGLSQRQVEQIRVAGLLHDVGLLSVPEEIINKPGQVTPDELRVLMQHPVMGAQMFRPIHALKEICDILENHHECWDGTGYPRGLKGEEIPLAARIIAIVDAYHAMISDRPYRPAMSKEKAKKVLRNGAGTQFDPFLVDIFIAVLSESEEPATPQQ